MTDDRVETHITIADDAAPGGRRAVHFQEYWVRLRAQPAALAVTLVGIEDARPAAGVAEAIGAADLILVAPSNPVVSIGPILAVPGLRAALTGASAPVVGFSGILGGAPVLGMAHRLLPAIGVAVDAGSVGLHYGSRTAGGVLDVWAMDTADAAAAEPGAGGRAGARGDRPDHERPGGDRRVHRVRGQVRHRVISIFAPAGIGEVDPQTDLAAVLAAAVAQDPAGPLADGDILVVTSKIVSKAEGRTAPAAEREQVITAETVQTVARRGPTRIVRTRTGLVLAAAGRRQLQRGRRARCCGCRRTPTPAPPGCGTPCSAAPAYASAWSSPTPPAGRGG